MVTIPTARDVLSKYSVTLSPDMEILRAIDVLVSKRAAGAPVVDEGGGLAGILTEKDCLRLLSSKTWGDVVGGKVRDFMSEPAVTITAAMDLFETAQAFLDTNFPVLPALDDDGKLVGRVTRQDVLRRIQVVNHCLHREREKEEKRLRQREPDSPRIARLEKTESPRELAAALTESE